MFPSPASLAVPSIPSPALRKYPKACIVCRDRKVKCDRQLPCSTCRRWGIQDCVYPSPIRVSPRPKRNETSGNSRSDNDGGPDQFLLQRLRKLEIMVQRLGGHIDSESSTDTPGTPADSTSDATTLSSHDQVTNGGTSSERGVGRLVTKYGRVRYLSPQFWVNVDEVDDLDVLVEPDSPASFVGSYQDVNEESNGFPFICYESDVRWLHPSMAEKKLYWQTYCERVDPVIKILHKPTVEKIVLQEENAFESLDKSTTALLFAIYYSATTSMTDNEVSMYLGQTRTATLQHYRNMLEKALNNAEFLETQELATLQAFLLYLICARHRGPKSIWTLCGLAKRLAQSMGLHRDGTKLGLSHLETENRRRLWWQVWYLDVRSSEDHGAESSEMNLDFDTKMPLNINDSDLDPNVTHPYEDRDGLTDMTFCRIRFEIARASCWIRNGTYGCTMSAKEKILNQCFQRMETKYLQYCHDGDTLYWLMENITRMLIDKSWFSLYHSPTWLQGEASMSRGLQDRLMTLAIQILERTEQMEHSPKAEKWIWLSRNYFQWLPRAFILAELCTREPSDLVSRAWKAIDQTFVTWTETTANSKNGILLKQLMAKASSKRRVVEAVDDSTSNFMNATNTSSVRLHTLSTQYSQYPSEGFNSSNLTDPTDPNLHLWGQDAAQPQFTFPSWNSTEFSDLNVANDPIYTGDWNHLMTDYGAIIRYDCIGSKSYPNIGPGV